MGNAACRRGSTAHRPFGTETENLCYRKSYQCSKKKQHLPSDPLSAYGGSKWLGAREKAHDARSSVRRLNRIGSRATRDADCLPSLARPNIDHHSTNTNLHNFQSRPFAPTPPPRHVLVIFFASGRNLYIGSHGHILGESGTLLAGPPHRQLIANCSSHCRLWCDPPV